MVTIRGVSDKHFKTSYEMHTCENANCTIKFPRKQKSKKGRRLPVGVRRAGSKTCSPNCSVEFNRQQNLALRIRIRQSKLIKIDK